MTIPEIQLLRKACNSRGDSMKKDKIVQRMSDGFEVVVHRWFPEGAVKQIVLLSHGMAEYAERYDEFGRLLAANNIAFIAEDHRGHGETAANAELNGTGKFGYLADKNGFYRVVDDLHEEVLSLRKAYPDTKVILFGHSFGSFLAQAYVENYGSSIDGCILCGTAGPREGLVHFAKCIASTIKLFTGGKHVSKGLDAIAFGSNNAHQKNPRTPFDWLSRDEANVDKYIADDWCGFTCTVGFFYDMFNGLCCIHTKKNMASIPYTLPMHLICGTADPVGTYGKTVQKLYDIYCRNGMKHVDLKWYEGARHELLNETNREEVAQELLSWIKAHA
jgi:alpha-beta hydrolase superfamily lysophospholipase